MATYLTPGVYVEETLQSLYGNPLAESTDAVAAFVGTSSKGGPVVPTLVTSWAQFTSLYGDVRGSTDSLPFAVHGFFQNGGTQAYVVRAVNSTATAAALTLNDPDADSAGSDTVEPCLTVTAKAPGLWASAATSTSRVFVTVEHGQNSGRFDLTIEVGSGGNQIARERWIDVTLDPADTRYVVALVNSPAGVGSNYVTLTPVGTFGDDTTASTVGNPAAVSRVPLVGGSDGTGSPDLYAATQRLDQVDSILTVNLPGVSDTTVLTNVINWAEASRNRFVVVDTPKPSAGSTNVGVTSDALTFVQSLPSSSYAAVYGPWVYASDPSSGVSGALRLTAPGALVLGQYVRTDVTRGVQKAPAGTTTALRINSAYVNFTGGQTDSLNTAGINVIRAVPGAGYCIMGARTLNPSAIDRYINVRRTLIYLKRVMTNLTRFAVFENNSEQTWDTVEAILEQFLTTFWQSGGLAGDVPSRAFFVTCDRSNNSAQSINAGILNVQVGVALQTPAEFIVISIGQYDGGSDISDSTEG